MGLLYFCLNWQDWRRLITKVIMLICAACYASMCKDEVAAAFLEPCVKSQGKIEMTRVDVCV